MTITPILQWMHGGFNVYNAMSAGIAVGIEVHRELRRAGIGRQMIDVQKTMRPIVLGKSPVGHDNAHWEASEYSAVRVEENLCSNFLFLFRIKRSLERRHSETAICFEKSLLRVCA